MYKIFTFESKHGPIVRVLANIKGILKNGFEVDLTDDDIFFEDVIKKGGLIPMKEYRPFFVEENGFD